MNTKVYILPYKQIKRILHNKELHTIQDMENFIKNMENTSNEEN